ncbi:MAG: response regulator [Phycisphaerales bacterium]|nr:response regulator [Phycisphaerales bacterium]
MPLVDQSREKLLASRLEAIADQMEMREDKSRSGGSGSRPGMHRYRSKGLMLLAQHPGGGIARFPAAVRHLSTTHVTVLSTCFLYNRTPCSMVLRELSGAPAPIKGEVIACRHIQHAIHETTLKLDTELDTSVFIDHEKKPSAASPAGAHSPQAPAAHAAPVETKPTPEVHASVLLVEDNDAERRLYEFLLAKAKAKVTAVTTAQEAIDACKKGGFDLILTDLNLASGSGEDVVKSVREQGFAGPILVITGELSGKRLAGLSQLGVSDVVCKPATPPVMLRAIVDALAEGRASGQPLPIRSIMDDDAESHAFIREYVQQIPALLTELTSATQANDVARVASALIQLKDGAEVHGFERIHRAVQLAMVNVETAELSTAKDVLAKLDALCRRATISAAPAQSSPNSVKLAA